MNAVSLNTNEVVEVKGESVPATDKTSTDHELASESTFTESQRQDERLAQLAGGAKKSSTTLDQVKWELLHTKKGVAVFKGTVKHNGDEIMVYKGVLKDSGLKSTTQFKAGVMDVKQYDGHIKYVKRIDVMASAPDQVTYYQYLSFIPGFSRHNALAMKVSQTTSGQMRISWTRTSLNTVNQPEDSTECPVNEGYWELNASTGELTQVLKVVTGGSVPERLANSATKDALPGNLFGMRDFILSH